MKSQAPPRIAETALSTSPKAVISSTGRPGWRLRISPSRVSPSIGDMRRSETTMLNVSFSSAASAAGPPSAPVMR